MMIRFLKNDSLYKKVMGVMLFAAYLFLLLYFTVFSESLGRTASEAETPRYNLILFKEIKRFCIYREQLGFRVFFLNIFGNIMAFIPCGYLLPSIFEKHRGPVLGILVGFSVSLLIECTQLVFKVGSFDVDDLLLNTAGAALGYAMWLVFHRYADIKYAERAAAAGEIWLND